MSTHHRLTVARSGRLDASVADGVQELSRARAAKLIKSGTVLVDGHVQTRPAAKVHRGAVVEVEVPPPAPAEALPQELPLSIVYEDEDLVVVDKAAGMVVHPSHGHADGTLVNALLHHVGDLSGIGGVQRPGIVHRLDKGTSGLLVVAKNDAAHQGLSAQFASHAAGRRYLALVIGKPVGVAGTIRSELARHPGDRTRFASTESGGKSAVTHWKVVVLADKVALLECRLETGRTHQIRVHMSEEGLPLVGDPTYKRRGIRLPTALRGVVSNDRQLLHARRLEFAHPRTGEACSFQAPLPDDFRAALDAVGVDYL